MARHAIPQPYADRVARVRARCARAKLDALLVENRMDQIWLTGFTGEDGLVLLTGREVVLLTDGRFDETADREAPWARKVVRKVRNVAATAAEITRRKLARVGFEAVHMTVAAHTALRKAVRPARLADARGMIRGLRLAKDASEVARIRRAIRIAEEVFTWITPRLEPGRTEREIAAELVHELQTRGAQGPSFPPIVASGASASLPHYEPGDARIENNAYLLIDWGARADWYVSDLTRTIAIGSIPADLKRVYETVRSAHDQAVQAVRPGVAASAVDAAARRIITKAGFGARFTHALGHGIGLDVHEGPRLGREVKDELVAGMVITIEPGIYLPGEGGVRIESDVLVTDSGGQVLSTLPY